MNIEFPDGYKYNLDMCIAHVIVEGIPPLRGKGWPPGLLEEEWDEILTDIEEGFRHYRDFFHTSAFDGAKADRAIKLLDEWFSHLWW